jgi:hypothetical protein
MLPPSLGLALEEVGVELELFLLPLLLLEHAAATRAKATTAETMVEWWRARSLVATFPPAVECCRVPSVKRVRMISPV